MTSNKLTRRGMLAGTGAAALLAGAGVRPALAADMPMLEWWDVYQPLQALHQTLWDDMAAKGVAEVNYTASNPSNIMQSLQLAYRGGNAPDVLNMPNVKASTLASLRAADWFQPLDNMGFDKPFQRAATAEGFTSFDGKLYGIPIFSALWHFASVWYSRDTAAAAGLDPTTGPASWDDMRAAAKAATGGENYGLMLPLQFGRRMADTFIDLAMAAGAPGEVDWHSGDYAYASAPFVEALEFLMSFQKDGSLHPASSAVDARQGRTRWAGGEALFFFDGPWNSGVLSSNFPEVVDGIGVANVPTPDGATAQVYRGPKAATFFLSSQSKHAAAASRVLEAFTSDEYYIALAERMDQPPLDLSAVERANVHPTYRTAVAGFAETMRIAPEPLLRNPAVSQVYAKMRDVTPGLGEIIQGAFSGAFSDPRPFLQQFADGMSRERDRALKAAQDEGHAVTLEDWVFADWVPGENYG